MDDQGTYAISGNANTPVMATLANEETRLFVTSDNGYIHSGAVPGNVLDVNRDLRRVGCASNVPATGPVLQLAAQSNVEFQQAVGQDLLMIGTRHGCSGHTVNQVIALTAGTLGPVWIFNSGEYEMDAVEDCLLDYSSNTLFCGSTLQSGSFQNKIWAINTLDGSFRWAANIGPVKKCFPKKPLQMWMGYVLVYLYAIAGKI